MIIIKKNTNSPLANFVKHIPTRGSRSSGLHDQLSNGAIPAGEAITLPELCGVVSAL